MADNLVFMEKFNSRYLSKEDILKLYNKLSDNGRIPLKNFENLQKMLYRTNYMMKCGNSYRKATREEYVNGAYGVYSEKESILDAYKTKYIDIVLDYILKGFTYDKDINAKKLIEVYEYMFTDSFVSDLSVIMSAEPFVFNKCESKYEEYTKDILTLLKRELDPDYGTNYEKTTFKIVAKMLKTKNYIPTQSQFKCINIEYSKLKKHRTELDKELITFAQKVINTVKVDDSYTEMLVNIANQAVSKNFLTEKQKNVLVAFNLDKYMSSRGISVGLKSNKLGNNLNDSVYEDIQLSQDEIDELPSFDTFNTGGI
jgi:hypothetical protein